MRQHPPTPSMDTGILPVTPHQPPSRDPGGASTGRVRVPAPLKVLIAASFLIALGYGLVAPVLPNFARSFDVGALATTFVVSAFAITRLLFAPASGRLVNRFGERYIYSAGLLIVALGSLIAGLATGYPILLLGRAIGGFGSVMFTVAAMGILVRNSPPSIRGRISSYYATAFLLGNILGPVLGAAAAGWGMRAPFFVYAALLFGAAVLITFLLREEPEEAAVNTQGIALPKPQLQLGQAWKFSNYRAALFTNFTMGWAVFGLQSSLIPLTAAALVLTYQSQNPDFTTLSATTLAGATMAVYAGGNALTQTFSGAASDRIGRRPMIFMGLLVAGLFTPVMGLVASPWFFIVTAAVLGIGSALMGPSLQASLSDIIGNQRSGGQPLAYYQMVTDIGLIIGPLVCGAIVDTAGFIPAFALCGALLLLASLLWIPALKPRFPAEVAEEGYTGR